MTFISLSSKGQLTLPGKIRRRLGLSKGDMLAVEEKDGEIVLKPITAIPVKMYSDKEIEDFLREDSLTPKERNTIDKDIDRMKRKAAKKR